MKSKVLLAIALATAASLCHSASAQQWRRDRYDTRWLPITDQELQQQVSAGARDAVALYRLWGRARYQYKQETYFSALRKLKQEQPQNGVALATYCAVLMDSNTMYGFGQFKFRTDPDEGSIEDIRRNLEKAKALAPKLWLNYMTEADVALLSNGNRAEATEEATRLCIKAVHLAPNLSFTNMKLGYALGNLAREQKSSRSRSARFYKMAQKMTPVNSDPGFLLLNVYRFYAPNPAEARQAGRAVLATIPPQVKLSTRQRAFLAKQGIKAPA